MNQIEDPRIEFYLRHQSLIEEWAGVRRDVRHAAHDFYASLAEDLGDVAAQLSSDVEVIGQDAGYPNLGLCKPDWQGEHLPRVAIVFEWQRSSSTFVDGWRMLGVRVEMQEAGGTELSKRVRHALSPIRKAAGFPNSNKSYWPAWRQGLTADGDEYWKDLVPYRELLVADIAVCWEAFGEIVDEAVKADGST